MYYIFLNVLYGVFLEVGCCLKTCKNPGKRPSRFEGFGFRVCGWMFVGCLSDFMVYLGFVGVAGVHL